MSSLFFSLSVCLKICQVYSSFHRISSLIFSEFSLLFSIVRFIDFYCYLYYFHPSLYFEFVLFLFVSRIFRHDLKLLITYFTSDITHTFSARKVSSQTALVVPYKFTYVGFSLSFSTMNIFKFLDIFSVTMEYLEVLLFSF